MLIQCDARQIALRDNVAQCCVTSPPYWALRVYPHKDQIGLERTPQEYVAELVKVFREVRRVLRPDGVLFMNIGDTYATGAGKVGCNPGGGSRGEKWRGAGPYDQDPKRRCPRGPMTSPNRMPLPGLKPKDLIGIPWRVALALQEDGWYLRSDIIWQKANPIPESAKDRVCRSHDYIFVLAKSRYYYWNRDAVKEPASDGPLGGRQMAEMRGEASAPRKKDYHDGRLDRFSAGKVTKKPPLTGAHGTLGQDGHGMRAHGLRDGWTPRNERNLRSVWTIATEQYSGDHFAVFPRKLAERCILLASRPGDLVFDPFVGAGTTVMAAQNLGRRGCGGDLSYQDLSRDRINGPLFAKTVNQ